MPTTRRTFLASAAAATSFACRAAAAARPAAARDPYAVPAALQKEMYERALQIARAHVRGGPQDPVYRRPFVDAAFSPNIFLWDTCFLACYAKYHRAELPITNALDNFYDRQKDDGHICREFTRTGDPMWPEDHPVSTNPPLLAFAELQLQSQAPDLQRLRAVYPRLKRQLDHLVAAYRMDDGLFFGDALGSGMDNIPRYPPGWRDDGRGIRPRDLHPEIFVYKGLSGLWNRQGRSVDLSAQVALFAEDLARIAGQVGAGHDVPALRRLYDDTRAAINHRCWSERDGFYYDLGYGKQIPRMHIGMFWTLIAGIASERQANALVTHLTDPRKFWRATPVAAYPGDQPGFSPDGGYWLGAVWAPTNYMVLLGLLRYGRSALARDLARRYYWAVAEVYRQRRTFFENYAPDRPAPGDPSRGDFCGWTAIAPITIYRELIAPA